MAIAFPKKINEGALVALLGPSSPLDGDRKTVDEAIASIESIGLRVKEYPSASAKADYLAGTDKQRAADINRAFADPKVEAIMCIRGGYGSSRLLDTIDWKAAAASRKPFLGFSDITSLIGGFTRVSKLVSYHATMAVYMLKDDAATASMRESTRRLLFEGLRGVSYREYCGDAFKPRAIKKGTARGTLVGGNLSLLAGLIGTPWMPMPKRAILFLEELSERPYKLDRYLTQMINSGWMNRVEGIVLGEFTDCEPKAPDTGTAFEVLERCLKPLGKPILAGLPVGHVRPTWPLPMGAEVEITAGAKGDLRVL